MDGLFLDAFRAAIESGRFETLADLYAPDATFEGFLPGGVREAAGADAIVAQLASELGPSPTLVEWRPLRATTVDVEIRRGDPPERKRQIHKVRLVDGRIERHWAYPVLLDTISMGDSGARHRRVERPDGTVVFEKLISPSHDWIMRVTRDRGREATLWLDGPLGDLPPSIDYPIVSAEPAGDGWLVTTRDVSADLLANEPTLAQWRQVIYGLRTLHERFPEPQPEGLCSIGDRVAILSEKMALAEIDGSDRYPKLILHGWRVAPAMLPSDLRDAILALARDPGPLVRALGNGPLTLIHGDATFENLGLRADRLIAIDWAMAARAPAELEFAWMLSGTAGDLRNEVIEVVRAALAGPGDERRWRIAMLFEFILELAQLGYVSATGAPEQADEAAENFSWWLARAREGLAALDA
jgi:Phosphotransferase enzyme family